MGNVAVNPEDLKSTSNGLSTRDLRAISSSSKPPTTATKPAESSPGAAATAPAPAPASSAPNSSEPGSDDFDLDSKEGQERLRALREAMPERVVAANAKLVDFICEASLRFRRGHLPSAKERALAYFEWREKYIGSFADQRISDDPELLRVLKTGLVRLVPVADSEGRAALVVQPKRHVPAKTSALQILHTWHYVIMKALKSPRCQERGVILVGDFGGAAFGNLDLRVPKAILGAIGKAVPLRLHRACIIRPFLLMRLVLPIIKMFMSEKLRQRLQVLGGPQDLEKYGVDMKKLPSDVGGTGGEQAHDYEAMLEQWIKEEGEEQKQKEKLSSEVKENAETDTATPQ